MARNYWPLTPALKTQDKPQSSHPQGSLDEPGGGPIPAGQRHCYSLERTDGGQMQFFDWLLGKSNIGWLKTGLLSGLLGFVILGSTMALTGGGTYEYQSGSRFFLLAFGFVFLVIIRSVYWNWRRRRLWAGIRRGDDRALDALFSLYARRPQMVPEFSPIMHAYLIAQERKSPYGPPRASD